MRTTVTLDPDVAALIGRAMSERGVSFKQAVNDAIRSGFAPSPREGSPELPVYDMGEPLVDLTKALQLAGELESREVLRKLAEGK